MFARNMGDDKTAKELWGEIANKEKAIDKYDEIIKSLAKAGMV